MNILHICTDRAALSGSVRNDIIRQLRLMVELILLGQSSRGMPRVGHGA